MTSNLGGLVPSGAPTCYAAGVHCHLPRRFGLPLLLLASWLGTAAKVQGTPQSLQWSLDGRYVVATGEHGPAVRASVRGLSSRIPADVQSARLSPEGRLVFGVIDETFVSIDLQTNEVVEVPIDDRLGKPVSWQRGPFGDVIVTRTVAHYNIRRTGGRSSDADASPTRNFRDLWLDPVEPLAYIDTGYGIEVRHLRTGLTLRAFDSGLRDQRFIGSVRDPHGRLLFGLEDEEGFRLWTPPDPPGDLWDFLPKGAPKALSGDGMLLAVGTDSALLMYATESRQQVSRTKVPSPIAQLSFAPDSGHVAAALANGAVRVWPTSSYGLSLPLSRDLSEVDVGRIRPDAISRGDLPRRLPVATWHLSGSTSHLSWGPSGLMGWVAGHLSVIDPSNGDERELAIRNLSPGRPYALSADDSQIAAVIDGGIGLFDMKRFRLARRLPTGGEHNQLQWESSVLVTDAGPGKAQAWNTDDGTPFGNAYVVSDELTARFQLSPSGQQLAVSGRAPRVLRATDGAQIASLEAQWAGVIAAIWSSDGRRLATAGGDGTVLVWDTASWKPLSLVEGLSGRVMTFSPDGEKLLSASWDGAVVANVSDGVLEQQLVFDGLLSSVDWSASGVVMADSAGSIYLWPP